MVMIPKPPTWISPRMTTSPKPDQYVGVSTTVRPVTQTALVAVKTATRSGACPPSARDTGSMSRTVPTATARAKAATTTWAGCRNAGIGRRLRSPPAAVRFIGSCSRRSRHVSPSSRGPR